jgi:hypothetical protein
MEVSRETVEAAANALAIYFKQLHPSGFGAARIEPAEGEEDGLTIIVVNTRMADLVMQALEVFRQERARQNRTTNEAGIVREQ